MRQDHQRQYRHYLAATCTAALLLSCAVDGRPPPASSPPQPVADRGSVEARNGLAVRYAGQGDYPRAIDLWRAMTAEMPDEPRSGFLFGNLGYAYFLAGDHERALAALEKACLLDPARARSWQHLGEVLEKMGQGERAARMFRQAESLRHHDAGADYALLRAAAAPVADVAEIGPAPEKFARTELLQRGDGLIELRRVGAAATTAEAPLRVEIRNGNGVPGMAASLARTVGGARLRVVRLVNETRFTVARSRVEYRAGREAAAQALASSLGPFALGADGACKGADLCLVLGRDFSDPAALRRSYLKQLGLQQSRRDNAPPAAYSQLMPPKPLLSATRLAGLP